MADSELVWPPLKTLAGKTPRAQAKILIQTTIRRYPSNCPDPESIGAFTNDWTEMIGSCGIHRFWNGLKLAVMSTSFFPVLADIKRHMPEPHNLSEYAGPTQEDIARKSAGERSYGVADIKELWKMHKAKREVKQRTLTQRELDALLDRLDARIDAL